MFRALTRSRATYQRAKVQWLSGNNNFFQQITKYQMYTDIFDKRTTLTRKDIQKRIKNI